MVGSVNDRIQKCGPVREFVLDDFDVLLGSAVGHEIPVNDPLFVCLLRGLTDVNVPDLSK